MNEVNLAHASVHELRPGGVCRMPSAHPEPPYDEKGSAAKAAKPSPVTMQGTLALSFVPLALPRPHRRPPLRLVPPPPGEDEREPVGLPALKPWAQRLGQAVVETLTGDRTPDQLVPWTTDRVHKAIALRLASRQGWRALPRGRLRPRVRSVRVYRPSRWVAEVTVIAHDGARPRALALRLEANGDRWLCTAVEFGR